MRAYSCLFFSLAVLYALVSAQGTCSSSSPCTSGCCGKSGFCGFGPAVSHSIYTIDSLANIASTVVMASALAVVTLRQSVVNMLLRVVVAVRSVSVAPNMASVCTELLLSEQYTNINKAEQHPSSVAKAVRTDVQQYSDHHARPMVTLQARSESDITNLGIPTDHAT